MSRPSSSSPGRLVSFALLFLATATAGWQLAGGKPAPAAGEKSAADRATKSSSRATRTRRVYGPTEQAKQLMRAVLDAGSAQDRMRATISLVNSLPLDEIGRWLDERWFEDRTGFELTLFNKLAKERWKREDPEGFLAWSIRENEQSSDAVFTRWAEEDPQRLLSFFKETPDLGKELQALGKIARNDPALALARYREMIANGEISMNDTYRAQGFLRDLAENSPAALEAALESLPDHVRLQAESALTGQRLKTDFDSEIRSLFERPDGWKLFETALNNGNNVNFGDKILADLDQFPASWKAKFSDVYYRFISDENAATWLALDYEGHGFEDRQAKFLKARAIQTLSGRDPEGAIRALESAGLDSSDRQNALRNIFSRFSRDEARTAELMALLGSEADRETVAQAVENRGDDPFGFGSASAKVETPDQWFEKAAAFDPQSNSGYELMRMLNGWNKEQMAELSKQFQTLPDESKVSVARAISGNDYGMGIDPALRGDAIAYLMERPATEDDENQDRATRNLVASASRHAVTWGLKDPQAASAWTSTLPEGDARLWAQKNLAANWAQYDPNAAKQWVATLPAADREAVDQYLKDGPKR
ncbi:hypothetical protein [Luteolibacter marinus]|uniref:hypothetical protein n=1 Tax=Luteolibacter marinus TaxID=2776705 RepID=UPI001865FE7C|nr:hypothetical protein [Luteolibacter marinus]